MSKSRFTKDFLYQKYIIEQNSKSQIAKEVGCNYSTIWRRLKETGIPMRKEYAKLDLTGKRFGKLMATCGSEKRNHGCVIWACRCDCGNLISVRSSSLKLGETKSCGCLQGELLSKRNAESNTNYKHGDCPHKRGGRTRLYGIWGSMKGRCGSVKHTSYKYYGGKGIEVCKEWRDDFVTFKNWALNSGYENDLTIHRIDSRGNYEPSNCQWITLSENFTIAIRERVARSMPIHFTTG